MSKKKEESKEENKDSNDIKMINEGGKCLVTMLANPRTLCLSKNDMTKFQYKIEGMLRCFIGESSKHVPRHHLMGTRIADNCMKGMKKQKYILAAIVQSSTIKQCS